MSNSLDQLKATGTGRDPAIHTLSPSRTSRAVSRDMQSPSLNPTPPENSIICGAIRGSQFSTVIGKYKPQDATTNPSLILAASKKAEYAKLIDAALEYAKALGGSVDEQVDAALDSLLVEFGCEILAIIPGKVSTEVDAQFSFDTDASVEKALHIIELYNKKGIPKDRILIKIAATWEGIKAAEILQRDHGINTNLTLMFSLVQAIAAAEAGAYLNSTEPVHKKFDAVQAASLDLEKKTYINNEANFRFDFNEDQMAVEKLREGISKFATDAVTLKDILKQKLA
ncbi:transaldolase [Ilyonectria destructans]|nr:transaldolase [Ilyonectria destructans]